MPAPIVGQVPAVMPPPILGSSACNNASPLALGEVKDTPLYMFLHCVHLCTNACSRD